MAELYGGPEDDIFDEQVGDGTTLIDGLGGSNTLNADWADAVGPVLAAIRTGFIPGPFEDEDLFPNFGDISGASTDGALHFENFDVLNLNTGPGDDTVSVDNSALQVNWDGGGGDDTFFGSYGDSHGPTTGAGVVEGPGHVYTIDGGTIRNVEHLFVFTGVANNSYDLMSLDGGFRFSDAGGDSDTLTMNLTASTHDISTVLDPAHSSAITDLVTGDILPFDGMEDVNVATGSGDDEFTYVDWDLAWERFNFDGGGGANRFTGNFSNRTGDISFTLDPTPGATSTIFGSAFYAFIGDSTLTNIQTVDLTTGAGADTLAGAAGNDTLSGGSGDDLLQGGGGDDTLSGDAGDNLLQGGAGNDSLYGYGGSATAVFSGDSNSYRVVSTGSAPPTITDLRPGSPDGTDTLYGVAFLRFTDQTIAGPSELDGPGPFDVHVGDGTAVVNGGGSVLNADWAAAAGAVTVLVNDIEIPSANPPADDTFINYGDITGGPAHGVLHFSGIDVLNLTTGAGDDFVGVIESGLQLNWDGGAGDDSFSADYGFSHGPTAHAGIGEGPGHVYYVASGGTITNVEHLNFAFSAMSATISLMSLDGDVRFTVRGSDDRLSEDLSASTHDIDTIFDPENPSSITDRVTGDSQPFDGVERLFVTTGSGDDTFRYIGRTGASDQITVDGGGGYNLFDGDFSGVAAISFALDETPGAISTIVGSGASIGGDSTLANIQSVFITAGPGDDTLTGGSHNDHFVGADGNDLLQGGGGDDTLSGGAGSDTAVYSGSLASYQLTSSGPGSVTVTDLRAGSPDGTDTLSGVEFLTFADQTVSAPGSNRAPTPGTDHLSTAYGAPLAVSVASLLANDTDPDGDPLTLTGVSAAQHGTVSLSGGQVIFTPYVGFVGAAAFSYAVDDGHGGTATGQAAVTVTGVSPAYLYRGAVSTSEVIDFTGDAKLHQVLLGSGDDMVFMGSGGGSAHLGSGRDQVFGGTGKDAVTFGPGLGTVTGGAGPDAFIFIKGQIADPASYGGQFDTVTDFTGAGAAWSPGRDFIYFQGFSKTSTITWEHDVNGTGHVYRIDDGAYSAEFELDYAGPAQPLIYGQYGFL